MAVVNEVSTVFSEDFCVVVQVMVPTLLISVANVLIFVDAGFSDTIFRTFSAAVIKSAHVEMARAARCFFEAREVILVLALVRAALLAVRDLSLDLSELALTPQDWMMVPTSSSYFLHLPKAARQIFIEAAKVLAESDILQVLMVFAAVDRVSLAQQVHAVALDFLRHSVSLVVNEVIAVLQVEISVRLGWGRLPASQAALIAVLQFNSVLVRFCICLAPALVELPAQERLDRLPPPASCSLLSTGLNTFFLPLFLPPVLFCFSIRLTCLR